MFGLPVVRYLKHMPSSLSMAISLLNYLTDTQAQVLMLQRPTCSAFALIASATIILLVCSFAEQREGQRKGHQAACRGSRRDASKESPQQALWR